jgi:hypothetical protein
VVPGLGLSPVGFDDIFSKPDDGLDGHIVAEPAAANKNE